MPLHTDPNVGLITQIASNHLTAGYFPLPTLLLFMSWSSPTYYKLLQNFQLGISNFFVNVVFNQNCTLGFLPQSTDVIHLDQSEYQEEKCMVKKCSHFIGYPIKLLIEKECNKDAKTLTITGSDDCMTIVDLFNILLPLPSPEPKPSLKIFKCESLTPWIRQ